MANKKVSQLVPTPAVDRDNDLFLVTQDRQLASPAEPSELASRGMPASVVSKIVIDDWDADLPSPALPTTPIIRAVFQGAPVEYEAYGTTIKDGQVYHNDGATLTPFGSDPVADWDATPTISNPSQQYSYGATYNDATGEMEFDNTGTLYESLFAPGANIYVSSVVLDTSVPIDDTLKTQFSFNSMSNTSGQMGFIGALFISNNIIATKQNVNDACLASLGAPGVSFPTDSATFGVVYGTGALGDIGCRSHAIGDSGGNFDTSTITNQVIGSTTVKASMGTDGTTIAVVADATDAPSSPTNYDQTYYSTAISTFSANYSGDFTLVLFAVHSIGGAAGITTGGLNGGDGLDLIYNATDTAVAYDATAYYGGNPQNSSAHTTFGSGGSQANYNAYINDDGDLQGLSGFSVPALPSEPIIRATTVYSPVFTPYVSYGTTVKNGSVYYNDGISLLDLSQQDIPFDQSLNTTDNVTFVNVNADEVDATYFKSTPTLIDATGWNDQTAAAPISAGVNIVNSMSFANDSLRLPAATADLVGTFIEVQNSIQQTLYIFPDVGDTIDLSTPPATPNAAVQVQTQSGYKSTILFYCQSVGNWTVKQNQGLQVESFVKFGQLQTTNKVIASTYAVGASVVANGGGSGTGFLMDSQNFGISLSSGSSQGSNPIIRAVNEYVTLTGSIAVTLPNPTMEAGYEGVSYGVRILVVNRTSEDLTVYPFSGNYIDSLNQNVPVVVKGGTAITFTSISNNRWSTSLSIGVDTVYDNVYVTGTTGTELSGLLADNANKPKIYFVNPAAAPQTYFIGGNDNAIRRGNILIGAKPTVTDIDIRASGYGAGSYLNFDRVENVYWQFNGDFGGTVTVREFKNSEIYVPNTFSSVATPGVAHIFGTSVTNPIVTNCTITSLYSTGVVRVPDGLILNGNCTLGGYPGPNYFEVSGDTTIYVNGQLTLPTNVLSGSGNLTIYISGGNSDDINLTHSSYSGELTIIELDRTNYQRYNYDIVFPTGTDQASATELATGLNYVRASINGGVRLPSGVPVGTVVEAHIEGDATRTVNIYPPTSGFFRTHSTSVWTTPVEVTTFSAALTRFKQYAKFMCVQSTLPELWIILENSDTANYNKLFVHGQLIQSAGNITADTNKDQLNATEITKYFSTVTGSPTTNDAIKLPALIANAYSHRYVVYNETGVDIRIYPSTADKIDQLGTNNPYVIKPGQTVAFETIDSVEWKSSQFVNPQADVTVSDLTVTNDLTVNNQNAAQALLPWEASALTAGPVTAQANKSYWVNSSSGIFTITLPLGSGLTAGDSIFFKDLTGDCGVIGNDNTVTLDPNGADAFEGIASGTYDMDVSNMGIEVTWSGPIYGWQITRLIKG